MKRFDNAKEIMEFVLLCCVTPTGKSSGVAGCSDFYAIPGQYGPRWIVPSCSRQGKSVLAQWHPYSFASKIKWKGLLLLYAMGVLGKVPGINLISVDSRSTLQIPGMDPWLTPVMYIGTPGAQQKAVVTFVSPDSGEPRVVMKVAFSEGATASLQREAMNLEKLADANVRCVPTILAVEDGGKRTWQTVLGGRLTSRKLTRAHIDWLLQLPISEKATTLSAQQKLLRNEFERNPALSGYNSQAVSAAITAIRGGPIPLVLVHGDFAPWNLKRQAYGKISAIDWEEADWSGLPLWDLCHFFLLQAHLFDSRNPVGKLSKSLLVKEYLKEMGINEKYLSALVMLYILFTISGCRGSHKEAYRGFLLNQIPSVLVV